MLPTQTLVSLNTLSCWGDPLCCDGPSCRLPGSTSTVADAYRWRNRTEGNRTVVEDGYYYLNNFDNILNSFGECGAQGALPGRSPAGPRGRGAGLSVASPSPAVGPTVSGPFWPRGSV